MNKLTGKESVRISADLIALLIEEVKSNGTATKRTGEKQVGVFPAPR